MEEKRSDRREVIGGKKRIAKNVGRRRWAGGSDRREEENREGRGREEGSAQAFSKGEDWKRAVRRP